MSPSSRSARRRGTKKRQVPYLFIGVVVIVIAGFAIAAVMSVKNRGVEVSKSIDVSGQSLPVFSSSTDDPAIGDKAPEVSGRALSGGNVTVGKPGEPTVIAFLAHWCPNCQQEVPRVTELYNSKNWPDNVKLTGVATQTSEERDNYPPSSWLANEKWPKPVLADDEKGTAAQAYGVSGFPFFVFVDKDGRVAGRASGQLNPTQLEQLVDALGKGKKLPLNELGGGESTPVGETPG